jgi:broad specificity phosphatase PhoE
MRDPLVIHVVRHGRTRSNRVGLVMGWLVFIHDAVVRAAVAWTLRVGPATYSHIDVANCSITTIHASTSGARLVALNDTSHLAGSER